MAEPWRTVLHRALECVAPWSRRLRMSDDDRQTPGGPRASYAKRAWGDAFRSLSLADQASPLGGDDLERLANSAYLIGSDDDFLKALSAPITCTATPARMRARRGVLSGSVFSYRFRASRAARQAGSRVRIGCSRK